MSECRNSIFHRTSVRQYEDRPVEKEKVGLMLRAAMAAPSAMNQQPWEYYVVTRREMIGRLAESTPYTGCAKEAPLVFVACYRRECLRPMYAHIDLSASVENLLLEADALGLGAVWMGIAPLEDRMETVKEIVDMPDGLEAFALIACVYPAKEQTQQDRYDETRVHYID